MQCAGTPASLSARRAWIEISCCSGWLLASFVALRKESVDRNKNAKPTKQAQCLVALRKESVDRNKSKDVSYSIIVKSLSARRAWIEICRSWRKQSSHHVALRKESVDRNTNLCVQHGESATSLSARRAWIEMAKSAAVTLAMVCRSPQGERG